ncbi:hypothetical protein, partial [Acidithiobacillus ferriphilus]
PSPTPPGQRGFLFAGVRAMEVLSKPLAASKSTARSPGNEGDRQGSPAVARVVVGKTARALAGRWLIRQGAVHEAVSPAGGRA